MTDRSSLIVRAPSAAAMRALGAALARAALPLPDDGIVIALHGDLGAGKTVFVKGVAEGLDVPRDVPVVSPTFTIARGYFTPTDVTLHHVDAYRLGGVDDLEAIGFEEMRGPRCFTCVEWAERVEEALPEDRIEIWIVMEEAEVETVPGAVPRASRRVTVQARGTTSARILGALRLPPLTVEG